METLTLLRACSGSQQNTQHSSLLNLEVEVALSLCCLQRQCPPASRLWSFQVRTRYNLSNSKVGEAHVKFSKNFLSMLCSLSGVVLWWLKTSPFRMFMYMAQGGESKWQSSFLANIPANYWEAILFSPQWKEKVITQLSTRHLLSMIEPPLQNVGYLPPTVLSSEASDKRKTARSISFNFLLQTCFIQAPHGTSSRIITWAWK